MSGARVKGRTGPLRESAPSPWWQSPGPAGAALAGFFDAHAAATSVQSLGSAGLLPAPGLVTAVLVGTSTNTLSKLVAAFGTGGVGYGLRVMAGLLLVIAAMWAPLLWH